MLPANEQTITPADLFRLEKFINSDACGEDAMGLSRAHGFLTAAVSGPETVMPEEWIRLIFDEPVFEDAAQADEMLGLVMRLYNDIARSLPERGSFNPVFDVVQDASGSKSFSADEWCMGYVAGMTLSGELWAEQSRHGLGDLMAPIFLVISPQNAEERQLLAEHYAALCDMLPQAAEDIYQFWLAQRLPAN